LFSIVLVLPASVTLATIAPAAWKIRARQLIRAGDGGSAEGTALALRAFTVVLMLGAAFGSFVTLLVLPVVGHWGFLNAIAVLLVLLAFLGLSIQVKFIVTIMVGVHFFFSSVTYQELVPMESALKASQIEARDSGQEVDWSRKKKFLTYAEVRKIFSEMRAKIVAAPDKSIGIKLVADTLESLGNVGITGSDFEKVYTEMITDPKVIRQTIPFVKRIRLIESDGFGRIYFQIRRIRGSARAVLVVPQKRGYVKLLFKSHFTLHISSETTPEGAEKTRIAIGPRNEVKGGLFSSSTSYYTPVTAIDAVGPFDVTMVYLDIINDPKFVSITVSGQGFIGGLKTKEIAHIEK